VNLIEDMEAVLVQETLIVQDLVLVVAVVLLFFNHKMLQQTQAN